MKSELSFFDYKARPGAKLIDWYINTVKVSPQRKLVFRKGAFKRADIFLCTR